MDVNLRKAKISALQLQQLIVGFAFEGAHLKVKHQQDIWEAQDAETPDELAINRLYCELGRAQAQADMGRALWAEFRPLGEALGVSISAGPARTWNAGREHASGLMGHMVRCEIERLLLAVQGEEED
jgi:hypothetical protein